MKSKPIETSEALDKALEEIKKCEEKEQMNDETVSYTHLDVYKRQSLSMSRPFSSRVGFMVNSSCSKVRYCSAAP